MMTPGDYIYFNELCELVDGKGSSVKSSEFYRLLNFLFSKEFYIMDDTMDDRRFEDIEQLRVSMGFYAREHSEILSEYFNVLEALVALADSLENKIMTNTEFGDRTSLWFWIMINNLGIDLYDFEFDEEYVDAVVERWLSRQFDSNGDGSPFPLKNPPEDMRQTPMWRAAQLYLSENFNGKW